MRPELLDRLRRQYGGSLVTTGTRLIDVPCRYGMHLMIALRLPLADVGAFYVVFGAMMLASGLGRIGIDRALTREMARVLSGGDTASARASMIRAFVSVGSLSLALTGIACAIAWPLAHVVMHKPEMMPLFLIGALTIIPQNMASVSAGALAGLHRVTQSQIVYTWLWPGIFCILAFLLPLTDVLALAAVAAAMTLAAIVGGIMLWRALPPRPSGPAARPVPLVATGLSLFSLELVQLSISAAPPFVLGIVASTEEVGLYAIAWRVVLVIYMFVSGVASMVSPRFAHLYMLNDTAGLKREAGKAIGFALALSILPILLVTIEPHRILLLFGTHFEPAASTLRILLLGQLAATLTTTTPELLGMTGYAKSLLRINAAALAMLLGGLALFAPRWGADGAAMATTMTMIVNAVGASWMSRRKLGFVPLGALYDAVGRRRRVAQ
jgi:O-antigen/teichoic acid export membrane protein